MKKMALAFFLLVGCNSSKPAAAPAVPAVPAQPTTVAASANALSSELPLIPVGTKMKCAVTGEDFTVSAKTIQTVYNGKRYAFCCADCLPEFNKNPTKFAQN
jgi:YHS domain-containing protein